MRTVTRRRLTGASLLFALLVGGTQIVVAQTTVTVANPAAITLPAGAPTTSSGPASPYPSNIVVAGAGSSITDVNVTISNFSHTWPNDIDVMLVGPQGQNIVLFSDAIGGSGGITGRTYTFDDGAAAPLPTTGFPASGPYQPMNSGAGDPFPAPAPASSGLTALSTFSGTNPNGTWSLYIVDDTAADVGVISGGWSLTITTPTGTFSNSTPIVIPATGTGASTGAPSNPYSSDIAVAGLTGVVTDVDVVLRGFSHTFPSDVDMLLVGPTGATLELVSDAWGGTDAVNLTFYFTDGVAAPPSSGTPVDGVYRPVDYTAADPYPAPAPAGTYGTALNAFNGTDPNGTWSLYVVDDASGDIGAIAGGWTLNITTSGSAPAPGAAFSVSPGGLNFATAGACSLPNVRRVGTFTMANHGASGTINVQSAVVTGSSTFSLELVSPAPPTFPVVLAPAASVNIGFAFFPTATDNGPQNAIVTFNYDIDGGPLMTETVSLTGNADAEGLGLHFRGSLADASCQSQAGAPGTTFVDFVGAGHTRLGALAAGTLQDGRWRVALPPEFPSFRMFGTDWPVIDITTNAVVGLIGSLAQTAVTSTTNYGGTTFTTGIPTLAIAGMNLNLDATVAGDNTGVGGAPGVFTGLADVDADLDQEYVITWWHAYDNTSVPGAAGQYFTVQMILFQASEPNEEDYYEIRFIDGNDANAVPFRQNTAVAGTDNSMENDATTGVIDAAGLELAAYRLRSGTQNAATAVVFGGPMYVGGGGSTGVRFQAETQETSTGVAGWRMLGVPVRNYTVGRLANVNLVQGIPESYPSEGVNLMTGYDGTGWVPATSAASVLAPGQGFLWYLYNQDIDPDSSPATSNSYTLPMALQGTGAEPLLDGNAAASVTLHGAGNGWNLVANPWRDDINVTGLPSWGVGGVLASGVGQIWDPNASSYVLTTTQGGLLAAWQGFMIQNNTGGGGATLLSVPNPHLIGATVIGRTDPPAMIAFELAGARADNGEPTLDRAAVLYFGEDAEEGWDLRDAGKLQPLTDRYATMAFLGERAGEPVLKAQESRSTEVTTFQLPLGVTAVGTTETLTVSWPEMVDVPADWSLVLRDLVTGTEVDMRQLESYTFTVTPSQPRASTGNMPSLGDADASLIDARFVLVVTAGVTGTDGGIPTVFALHALAPNPVSGSSAVVRFDLPEAAEASIEVFDMLGRRVATLAEGAREAGRHTARLDAAALSSGVYVVRMRAGDFVQAQRVTVSR